MVHVIPQDAIGGVEVAARSLSDGLYGNISFEKYYIFDRQPFPSIGVKRFLRVFHSFIKAFFYLRSVNPDIVVCSLWSSCILLVLLKISWSSTKLVVFLHLPKSQHFLDSALNKISIYLSDSVWADSAATYKSRIPPTFYRKSRTISFLTRRINCDNRKQVMPKFIFWGRLHPQKNLMLALDIFLTIRRICLAAKFHIIGPNDGEFISISSKVARSNLEDSVIFHGALTYDQISAVAEGCSFYLQTSRVEGMAMSVVEAMQLGLVPVVTPVGEIANYCKHLENSVIIDENADVINTILNLLNDEREYSRLSNAAQSTWKSVPLYSDTFIDACSELLR